MKLLSGEPWFRGRTIDGLVMEALATAWGSPLEDVVQVSEFSTDDADFVREVGCIDDSVVSERVDVIRNPHSISGLGR